MRCGYNGHPNGLNRTIERDDLIQIASLKWIGIVREWQGTDLKHLERRIFRAAINVMLDYLQTQDKHKRRRAPEEAAVIVEDPDQRIGIGRIDMRKVFALPIVERRLVMEALGLNEVDGLVVGSPTGSPGRQLMSSIKHGRARRAARARIAETVLS